MNSLLDWAIVFIGISLVALGAIGMAPTVIRALRKPADYSPWLASPASLFVDSGRYPIGKPTPAEPRQSESSVAAEEERLAGLLTEVEALRAQVASLRSEPSANRPLTRQRPRRCDLPAPVRRAFVDCLRQRRARVEVIGVDSGLRAFLRRSESQLELDIRAEAQRIADRTTLRGA